MKSIIKTNDAKTKYPCLKEYTEGGKKTVVLFYSKESGVIVWSERPDYPNGYHQIIWDEDLFTLCPDTIELSNN